MTPLRIANAQGFWGDSLDAASKLAAGCPTWTTSRSTISLKCRCRSSPSNGSATLRLVMPAIFSMWCDRWFRSGEREERCVSSPMAGD